MVVPLVPQSQEAKAGRSEFQASQGYTDKPCLGTPPKKTNKQTKKLLLKLRQE